VQGLVKLPEYRMKILFAVDGSDYTRRALDYLCAHDWLRHDNALAVFTVVLRVPHRAAAMAGPNLTHAYYQDDAEVSLRPVREVLAASGAPAEFSWEIGHPAQAIANKATREGFDLVVMGSHGHGALANVVLGSVAPQVLALCKVPVLLIR
jgi:nucleotide-binding universal stress UspA family protein